MGAGPAYGAESTGSVFLPPQGTGVWHPGIRTCWICLWEGKEMNTDGRGQDLAEEADIIFGDRN